MRFFASNCSDKGFVLSTDALLAAVLLVAFMSFALIINFEQDIVSPVSTLSRSARDVLVNLDENAAVFAVLDENLSSAQQMDLIEQETVSLLPENAHYRIELERFLFDPNSCQQTQSYENCFSSAGLFPVKGEQLPTNKTLASEKKIFFRKGTQTFCSIGETGELESKATCFPESLVAFFGADNSSKRQTARFESAGDPNIDFYSCVHPVGTVSCDPSITVPCNQPIQVDLNVSVLSGGRPPVDVMLVMDRSGSMSWGGIAPATDSRALLLDNNFSFVADGSAGVRDVNITDPSLPNLLDQYNTTGTTYDLDKNGNYVFVADGGSGFRILNAANPLNITSVSTLGNVGTANGVATQGNFAFLATTGAGPIFDVVTATSNNADIRIGYNASGSWAGQSFATNNAVITGVQLYLRRNGNPNDLNIHLRTVIDGTDIASIGYPAASVGTTYSWENIDFPFPVPVSSGNTYFVVVTTGSQSTSNYYRWGYRTTNVYSQGQAYQQTTPLSGDLLLRTYVYAGLETVDIGNVNSPVLAGTFSLGDAQKIVVQNNYLYLSEGTNGFRVFDVSNPAVPVLLGSRATTDADGLFVSGNYAFVADHGSGLQIIDVSNKSNPVIASTYNTPGTAYDVWVENNLAFVADNTSLQIIDVSNPSNPVFARTFSTPYNYRGIVVRGNWAFLASGNQGFITIDLSVGPRINQAKAAGSRFLDYNLWKSPDQIGLSSFSSSATLDQGLTTNRQDVNAALYTLVASGSTNMADGIRNATAELTTSPRQNPNAKKFQVMLSDGQANAGDDPAIAAQEARDKNIVIFTIGFGSDADASQLQTIASITGGQYYFASDQNALAALYIIIAEEIGELAGGGQTQTVRDANLLVPIPDGSTILDYDGGSFLQIGNQGYVYYFIGDLNKDRQTWSGYFILQFDCNSNFSCSDTNRVLPPDGTFFEWKDINGVPRPPLPWDSNAIVFLKYRDLTVNVLSAEPGSHSNILMDINAINAGYLSTPATTVEVLLGNPIDGIPVAPVQGVPVFSCGAKEPGCSLFSHLFFDVETSQEGELFVVINRNPGNNPNLYECPNNNVVRVFCSTTKSEFLVMRLWVWR